MISTDTARLLAGYNRWCNERLYRAAADLTAAELRTDRGVFFGSMLGTLNHLLVADRIWMQRFTGTGDAPDRLDAILFEDFAELQQARQAEDARIAHWIDRLTDHDLDSPISYRSLSDPRDFTQKLGAALLHVFNHQTHHRGQAHAILTGFGRAAPGFDLVTYQRETGHS
ncbi:DinB family protein [Aurantimonas litoralis]|nr:DinB family protein [Aurantimonas litoralis]